MSPLMEKLLKNSSWWIHSQSKTGQQMTKPTSFAVLEQIDGLKGKIWTSLLNFSLATLCSLFRVHSRWGIILTSLTNIHFFYSLNCSLLHKRRYWNFKSLLTPHSTETYFKIHFRIYSEILKREMGRQLPFKILRIFQGPSYNMAKGMFNPASKNTKKRPVNFWQ